MFYREWLLAPRPTPKLEDHPLSAVHDCLFNLFAATLHIGGRSSIRNLKKRHAVVTLLHTLRGKNTEFRNVRDSGTYSYHRALTGRSEKKKKIISASQLRCVNKHTLISKNKPWNIIIWRCWKLESSEVLNLQQYRCENLHTPQ